jgi:hypothetical protein
MIAYPLRVNGPEGRRRLYRSSASVRADYRRIFTSGVRSAILAQTFETLFARDTGIMIGNGEVWFDHICPNTRCDPLGPVRISAINVR